MGYSCFQLVVFAAVAFVILKYCFKHLFQKPLRFNIFSLLFLCGPGCFSWSSFCVGSLWAFALHISNPVGYAASPGALLTYSCRCACWAEFLDAAVGIMCIQAIPLWSYCARFLSELFLYFRNQVPPPSPFK